MKICLITDLHFGARNDSSSISAFQKEFFDNVLFPYLKEHNITHIIDLGDTFDRRKYINFVTYEHSKEMFFNPIQEGGYKFYAIVGNHDAYFKNTLSTNSMDLLTKTHDNIHIINKPQTITFDGLDILMIPWICEENEQEIKDIALQTNAKVLFGHLELSGYQMHQGQAVSEGMDDNWLQKFDLVCTGHYHTKSRKGPINYLGCPYEMTWADYNDVKGFHILDTETKELTFIENPNKLFFKLFYDDTDITLEEITKSEYDIFNNKYVRIIIKQKNDQEKLDALIKMINNANPANLEVVDDNLNLDIQDDVHVDDIHDMYSIFEQFINTKDAIKDKKPVLGLVQELYNTSLSET